MALRFAPKKPTKSMSIGHDHVRERCHGQIHDVLGLSVCELMRALVGWMYCDCVRPGWQAADMASM